MDRFQPSAKPCRRCGALQDLVWTPDTSPVIHLETHPLLSSSVPETGSSSPPAHEPPLHLFARSHFCNLSPYYFCFLCFSFVCLPRLRIRLCQWRMTTRGNNTNAAWMRWVRHSTGGGGRVFGQSGVQRDWQWIQCDFFYFKALYNPPNIPNTLDLY